MNVYAKAGVNAALGDLFSAFAASVCRRTWRNSRYVEVYDYASGHFRGPRAYDFVNLPTGSKRDGGMDGVGTKTGPIVAALSPRTAGHDIVAMTGMDRTRWGYLPLYLDNILDVSKLGDDEGDPRYRFFCEVMLGLEEAANKIGIVLGYGGELAELGDFVGSENPHAFAKFNWGGHMQGAVHPKRIIRGEYIAVGDIVIALIERGPRSNGLSAIRRALRARFGREWWNNPDAKPFIALAATPSELYDKLLTTLNGWHSKGWEPVVPVKGIAHVSGGGIPGKFADDILFRLGLSAELDNLPEPPRILLECHEWLLRGGNDVPAEEVPETDCYKMWPGGVGAIVVVAREYEHVFHRHAEAHGIGSQSCGVITKRDEPRLIMRSRFSSGATLEFS